MTDSIAGSTAPGFAEFSAETIELKGRQFRIRRANQADLSALVALLRDDILGASRESSTAEDSDAYLRAFHLIDSDPNQLLVALEEITGGQTPQLDGTLQLTLIPSLSRRGSTRVQIEAVRVDSRVQGLGLGTAVFEWAHACGRRFGASVAQLTTDKARTDAHRFYARLGYEASHEGLKLSLDRLN